MYQINSAATSFVTKMTKITENYFAIQQFWSFRQGWSKVEGLVLSEWVQTVVENQSGRFRTKNPCHQPSTSLYTVQTWLPHTSHKGHKYGKTFERVDFLKNNTLPWGKNGWATLKKEHNHNNATTTTTLAVSTQNMGQTEARQTWSVQFSAVRLLVNQELPSHLLKSEETCTEHKTPSTNSIDHSCLA